jgi:Zn-dependent M28 family amino/carboxypeptidase
MLAMFFILMGGPANKHTANDNTSGVITLVELYCAMTPQQRSKAAFVFFDNEENGLLGSSTLKAAYKKQGINSKLLVNFDCVSDGDYLMLVLKKKADKAYREVFAQSFCSEGNKQILLETEKSAFYPSDQKLFDYGVGVAALKKGKRIGYYMDKIHTAKDTAFDEANIQLLVRSSLALTDRV